ncbi:unnamed protein product [Gadus morhua 'NCC']
MKKFNIRKVLDGLKEVSSSAPSVQVGPQENNLVHETLQSEHFQLCKNIWRFIVDVDPVSLFVSSALHILMGRVCLIQTAIHRTTECSRRPRRGSVVLVAAATAAARRLVLQGSGAHSSVPLSLLLQLDHLSQQRDLLPPLQLQMDAPIRPSSAFHFVLTD